MNPQICFFLKPLVTEWLDSVAQYAAKMLFEMLFIGLEHDNDLTNFFLFDNAFFIIRVSLLKAMFEL